MNALLLVRRRLVLTSERDSAESAGAVAGPRILILGGDSDGNLGDRAILQVMCRELRALLPDAALTVVSRSVARARRELGARAIAPGVGGFLRLCATAARSDLVLCGGGGLFQDDDSLVKMPYWGLRVALMRLFCRRVVGYALGVGPLDAASSRLFGRLAFACMERVGVRDAEAQRTAQPLTAKTVEIVPDPAILLAPVEDETARRRLGDNDVPLDGRLLIGVALRRWFPPRRRLIPNRIAARFRRGGPKRTPESERFSELLAEVLDRVATRHDAHVVFLPTYTVGHEGDGRMCREVIGKMTAAERCTVLALDDPALYKGITKQLGALLGGRMHPTIFASAVGTPIVGLAYNQKFRGYFDLLGLGDNLVEVERFVRDGSADELAAKLDAAIGAPFGASDRVAAQADRLRAFNQSLFP